MSGDKEAEAEGPDGRDGASDGPTSNADEAEALRKREPIWGRLSVRTVVAAVLVLALLVTLGLLLGPEYWRF